MYNNRKKATAAASMTAVAALALIGGGVFATFTDSSTAAPKVMTAGTIDVTATPGANWSSDLDNLGVEDTATKTATITNDSSLEIGSIHLSADVVDVPGEFGGNLSDAVHVDILQGATVLGSDVPMSAMAAGYDLVLATPLAAHTDVPLTFHYTFEGAPAGELGSRVLGARESASNPDNKYQGSQLTVTYTIDAVQRPGVDHS